jgi:hypothetical protein
MKKRQSSSRTFLVGLFIAAFLCASAGASHAATLLSAYSKAGPGEGYDKLVILDRGEIYSGPLTIPSNVSCCIRGNDAICSVGPSDIAISAGALLDIFDTVITNAHYGLHYVEGSSGTVSGNTIYDCVDGVRAIVAQVTVVNNIIANNSGMGIAVDTTLSPPYVAYNNVWGNTGGNYMSFCSG